jgi:O-antigen/teichoic acid export membrane protein
MYSVSINKIINIFLKNLSEFQIISKNSFWIVLGKLGGGIFRALLVILSARYLGASEYGAFSIAMNFVLLFSFLPELGLSVILTRELSKAQEEEKKQKIFNTIFSLSIILSLISYLLIIITGKFFIKNNISLNLLPILGIMMILDIFREFTYGVYRSQLRGELQGIFHFLTNLILLIIGFLFLKYFKNSFYLSLAYLIGIGIGLILSSIFLINYIRKFRIIFNLKEYWYYFNFSWPIALANALYLSLLFIDSLILGWYFQSFIVGLYTSAVKINEFLIVFPTGIALALLPMFSKNIENKEMLRKNLEFGIKISYLLVLPIIFCGFILSKEIINFIFGQEYLEGHIGLKILLPSFIASSLFMIFSQFLIAINKRRELIIYEIIVFIVNFMGNLILIPKISFIGAAYTTTLSNYLSFIFGFFIVNKYINFDLYKGIFKPLISSLITALISFIFLSLKINLIIIFIFCIFIYLLCLFLLKEELLLKTIKKIFQ